MTQPEKTIEFFTDQAAFRDWLARNHTLQKGIWIKFAKKGTGYASLNYDGALDVALCFGWIDGQVKRIDDEFYMQSFTPRRARSPWSKRNCGKVEELLAQGLMQPPGQAEIDRAKADGRWDRAYEGQAAAELPKDFLDELAKNPAAQDFFDTLNKQNQYAVHFRLHDATVPATRARRIAKYVEMFANGEKFH
ncbi:YdeI/OmpD-associated family protein [Antrihabitans spumae]|uniref:YdeI family protein n=1 Tax=Antrihabitans spumae TaxID=3373370 RepID=A0ABW7K519_9NOCA